MRAITIRQPWATLIAEGEKLVENRTWATPHRGILLIHAANARTHVPHEERDEHSYRAIIGAARIVDVCSVAEYRRHYRVADPHCIGPCCWVLADPVMLERPINCPGSRKLWTPDRPILRRVVRQLPARLKRHMRD